VNYFRITIVLIVCSFPFVYWIANCLPVRTQNFLRALHRGWRTRIGATVHSEMPVKERCFLQGITRVCTRTRHSRGVTYPTENRVSIQKPKTISLLRRGSVSLPARCAPVLPCQESHLWRAIRAFQFAKRFQIEDVRKRRYRPTVISILNRSLLCTINRASLPLCCETRQMQDEQAAFVIKMQTCSDRHDLSCDQ